MVFISISIQCTCINFVYAHIANWYIWVLLGFKKAPGTPSISIAKDCNALSVGWVPSSSGDPAISIAVHIQGHGTDREETVDEGTNYNIYFSGLESNTLYSITVTAINCAGSNKVNTTVYTC